MSVCRLFSCVVGRGCLLWPVHFLGKTLLVFALLHSSFQGQICLLLQVFLDFLLLHSSPSPVINSTLSSLSTKTFFRTGNKPSQQHGTKWSWNAPQSMVWFMTTREPCHKGAEIDTYEEHCQQLNNKGICHLPLQEIELHAAIAVDLQQPLKEFRVEWGALGNLVGQVFR